MLTNVAVLTEGFDDPGVSCVAMARPTRSEGLYAQCVGRGTRLAEGKSDCLILDFVDSRTLSLCTLPSLFGVPRDLDLRGEDASEARARVAADPVRSSRLRARGRRAHAARDPGPRGELRPADARADPEVRAISANAWFSLGRHGVGLHFERAPGVTSTVIVLKRGARGKRWEVAIDDRAMERFSTLEDAVQAVDYEIDQPRSRRSCLRARRRALAQRTAARGARRATAREAARDVASGGATPHVWEAVTRR